MSKKMKKMTMLLLTLIVIVAGFAIAVKVSAKTEEKECRVEKNIYMQAKKDASYYAKNCAKVKGMYYIAQFDVEDDKALGIFVEGTNDCLQSVYERKEYINCTEEELKYTPSEFEIPQFIYDELESAKELAKQYVNDSVIIKDEDKADIFGVIDNVKLNYIEIDEQEEKFKYSVPLFTKETEIFVNDDLMMSSIINRDMLLHELVHVISNVTNKASKYENSFYNHNMITEALTELITNQIVDVYGKEVENEALYQVSYENYIDCVSALIGKTDLLKAYFYSDYFDEIFSNVNKDALRFLYLYIDASDISVENKLMNWMYIWDIV